MITTMLFSVGIFLLAVLGLGLGVWLRGRPIEGSCGGLTCLKKLGLGCAGGCTKEETHHG